MIFYEILKNENFSKIFTAEIQQKLKSNDLSFCCISAVKVSGKIENFQFSKFHRKASKDRMNMIFEENIRPILRLSAKKKIVVIQPIINFLKDTFPPLKTRHFSKSTL